MRIIATTHAGMTTEEFDQMVRDWLATAKHPNVFLKGQVPPGLRFRVFTGSRQTTSLIWFPSPLCRWVFSRTGPCR
jgi:hypothetical protein